MYDKFNRLQREMSELEVMRVKPPDGIMKCLRVVVVVIRIRGGSFCC